MPRMPTPTKTTAVAVERLRSGNVAADGRLALNFDLGPEQLMLALPNDEAEKVLAVVAATVGRAQKHRKSNGSERFVLPATSFTTAVHLGSNSVVLSFEVLGSAQLSYTLTPEQSVEFLRGVQEALELLSVPPEGTPRN